MIRSRLHTLWNLRFTHKGLEGHQSPDPPLLYFVLPLLEGRCMIGIQLLNSSIGMCLCVWVAMSLHVCVFVCLWWRDVFPLPIYSLEVQLAAVTVDWVKDIHLTGCLICWFPFQTPTPHKDVFNKSPTSSQSARLCIDLMVVTCTKPCMQPLIDDRCNCIVLGTCIFLSTCGP